MSKIGRPPKQFCPKGHDKNIVGKTKRGACKECRKLRQRKDPTIDGRIVKHQFCSRGHDKDVVGRTKDGRCRRCKVEAERKKYIPHPRDNRFCINGHDTFECGRYRNGKGNCIACAKEYGPKYYDENHERLLEEKKEYYYANHDIVLEREREYQRTHRESINKTLRDKVTTNINFKLAHNLRGRFLRALKRNSKRGSAVRDLGCTIEFLKQYLESKFYGGMTWNNYGTYWEIDHIISLWKFNLSDREELLVAVNYNNLQPLTVEDHRKKTAKEMIEFRRLNNHV